MQQVFSETEFLNSVIDYNHKIEAENLCLDIAYGTDKNFLFGCGISIASILKYNEGNQLCFHIFLLIISVMTIANILMPGRNIKQELRYI